MSLEWFDRVCEELQEHLESICEQYDEVGQMAIIRAAKHPRIEFFVESDDEVREYFCTLFFDPLNQEFYLETFELEAGQVSRMILPDIEEIVEEIHESFHEFLEDEDEEEYDDDELLETVHVDWTAPEKLLFHDAGEVEVTLQFGIIEETGDGILRRMTRIETPDREWLEDESHFIFGKEEAETILAMIAGNLSEMKKYE
ncbi:hypothetical protein MKY41_03795 [Sporosarcina sp. FSL W7-1349]|uniref:hypothetical protein n=1 Tax=Bacillales TaxID=1385 RepID=UPI00058209F2|nr:hypothetical protein [Bacillus sp. OxB-1]BAQ11093.1 hypothetical protein OXB_2622 [Bacillus sp. OxB-1]